MTRTVLAFTAVLLSAPVVLAQPMPGVGGAQRPTFSPYLNLLNTGNNPGLNYLGIVRPQIQMQQQFNQLQQQTNQQLHSLGAAYDTQLDTLAGALLPPTGNVSTFGNLGGYFGRIPMGNGVGGAGGSRFGGMGGAMSNLQRPGFAGGGGGIGGGARAPAGGGLRR